MSDADRLNRILARQHTDEPEPANSGVGGELKLDPDTLAGTLGVTKEGDSDPVWADELRFVGVNPDDFEVYGPYVEVRSWDAPVGNGEVKRLRYVKARIRPRQHDRVDADALLKMIRSTRPSRRKHPLDTGRTDVLCLSDWQIGKAGEAGGGTPETVDRVIDTIGMMQDRIIEHQRAGKRAGRLVVAGMGDNVEQCFGHYAAQRFAVDLNEREQKRTARHLLIKVLAELAPYYDRVDTFSVASNHGENRDSGKKATDESDSLDLELWENIAEYVDAADQLGHVNVYAPRDPLVFTMHVAGTPIAFTHGHKATSGGNTPMAKMWTWWSEQRAGDNPIELSDGRTIGNLPAGRCSVLVAAHYHHHYRRDQQGRTLLGCPALDGGSRWFTDVRGVWSTPATMTFSLDGRSRPTDVDLLTP